ncbi:MAG: hypothetical protein ABI823_05065 [Bryobacteraceae bacterium]
MWELAALVVGTSLAFAQQDTGLPPELLLLARVKLHAQETLERLPNYTCLETVERSDRTLPSKRFRLVDTLRLEVALVDGHELFAWPGAKGFETKDLRDIVKTGTISNGDFALFAKTVFQSFAPQYTYRGMATVEGRPAHRWDFRVSLMNSGYHLRIGDREGLAGYHGSFWIDPLSLDVMRLEFEAEDIPANLDLSSATTRMDYARRKIGESAFLLPASSDLTLVDLRGNEKHNRIAFSDCRQYVGESVLRFDDAPATAPSGPVTAEIPAVALPPRMYVTTVLEKDIILNTAAVGDPIRAIVSENAKMKRKIVVPKGAVLSGRIVELQRAPDGFYLSMQFTDLEWPSGRSVFTAVGDESAPGVNSPVRSLRSPALPETLRPGTIRLFLSPSSVKLSAGYAAHWWTGNAPRAK